MSMFSYPSRPKNDAHDKDADPAPIKAILVFATRGSKG